MFTSLLVAGVFALSLSQPALAKSPTRSGSMWRVTGKVSKRWATKLGYRHTTNLLGHRNFRLQHVRSGRDALFTEHYKAVPKKGARFRPFAVHVQRAKIQPSIIAPRGTSRVSFGSLRGLSSKLKR
jgi:hypothetical protein